MSYSIDRNGSKPRIGENYLVKAPRCRISVISSLKVGLDILSYCRYLFKKYFADSVAFYLSVFLGHRSPFGAKIKCKGNLFV